MEMRSFEPELDPENPKVGGLTFFVSLVFVSIIAIVNAYHLPALWDSVAFYNWTRFGMGFVIGGWFASLFLRNRLAVFIHETKHAVLSGLVGNQAKAIKVQKHTGHYEYSYTKQTKRYNAFIALAPYWLPLFSFPCILIALATGVTQQLLLMAVGAAYGADTITNIREISPTQTDLTGIRGGYKVALFYIIAINLCVLSIVAAWVCQGLYGLNYLLFGMWELISDIVVVHYPGLVMYTNQT